LISSVTSALAQVHQHEMVAGPGWTWAASARVFANANFQVRKFTDFYQFESQNWFMAEAQHRAGRGQFTLHAMLSLEPLTLRRLGSAQVFQTGETLDGAPLIDYQHPHDFFMALEARYERPAGKSVRFWVSAAPVGAAAIGPTPFMHRASAEGNPTAPLAHHNLDSAHISRSVLSAGIARGVVFAEASVFKGREPDENRWDLDLGVPDSWSARAGFTHGGWRLQFSGGHFETPEANEPFVDIVRLTASAEYDGFVKGKALALTIAAGRNREVYGDLDGVLIEATWRPTTRNVTYVRAETVEKNILTAGGVHPPGFRHPHIFSTIGAYTAGFMRDLTHTRAGLFSAGADLTLHVVPANLLDSYGEHPYSVHLFLRWRVTTGHDR
jgi:hypothetical protein